MWVYFIHGFSFGEVWCNFVESCVVDNLFFVFFSRNPLLVFRFC